MLPFEAKSGASQSSLDLQCCGLQSTQVTFMIPLCKFSVENILTLIISSKPWGPMQLTVQKMLHMMHMLGRIFFISLSPLCWRICSVYTLEVNEFVSMGVYLGVFRHISVSLSHRIERHCISTCCFGWKIHH